MNRETFRGFALPRVVDEVTRLVTAGEVLSPLLADLEQQRGLGLWRVDGDQLTATPALVTMGDHLPNACERVPAVFSLFPELRAAWLRIVRAHCNELGQRTDRGALIDTVERAGVLAAELSAVVDPSFAATAFSDLERAVLPGAAHGPPAYPVLLRVLAASAAHEPIPAAPPLPEPRFNDPGSAWCCGRLLHLPETDGDRAPATRAVLSGAFAGRGDGGDSMQWVLAHPWAYLLAQCVYTQETWRAERCAGAVRFELEPAHLTQWQNPARVVVVVVQPDGAEVLCGSLGELLQRTLARLGVTLSAHRCEPNLLDQRLGLVIQALLRHNVWSFESGPLGRLPGYVIHADFSDACYRALGSRTFNRLGRPITEAVREAAVIWAGECGASTRARPIEVRS